MLLNSDDRYLPRKLEACLALAEANPTKQVISGRLEVIDEQGAIMPPDAKRARWFYGAQSLTEADRSNVAELLGKANFIATTSNVFARTDYLLANPFRPYRFNHDYYFLAGAAWRDVIGLVPEVLMQYRVHGNNTIATKPEPLIREMLRMHLDLFHDYAADLAQNAAMRARFSDYCRALWDNISSFHGGMFQVAIAQIVAEVPEEKLQALAYSLQGPEFDTSPNRGLAGSLRWHGTAVSHHLEQQAGCAARGEDEVERRARGLERAAQGEASPARLALGCHGHGFWFGSCLDQERRQRPHRETGQAARSLCAIGLAEAGGGAGSVSAVSYERRDRQ